MPRAKVYPGRVVRNHRHKHKKMHLIATYPSRGVTMGIYSDAVDIFVSEIVERYRNDMQSVIVTEGGTGSGKSTFSIQLCLAIAKAIDVDFDLSHDYIYSLEDLWEKLETSVGSPISLFDEGAVTLASGNAQKKQDKDMVTLFNTMRSRHWITVINIPSIYNLNKSVRAVHADYKCRCNDPDKPLIKGYSRGFIEISRAERYEFNQNSDPYWFLMYTGVFGDLPKKVKEKYLPIKSNSQDKLVTDIIERARAEEERASRRKKKDTEEEEEE